MTAANTAVGYALQAAKHVKRVTEEATAAMNEERALAAAGREAWGLMFPVFGGQPRSLVGEAMPGWYAKSAQPWHDAASHIEIRTRGNSDARQFLEPLSRQAEKVAELATAVGRPSSPEMAEAWLSLCASKLEETAASCQAASDRIARWREYQKETAAKLEECRRLGPWKPSAPAESPPWWKKVCP